MRGGLPGRVAALTLLLFLFLATGCAEREPPPPPELTPVPALATLNVGLTDAAATAGPILAEAYASERAALQFVVANNTTLFADLEAGQLDALLVHSLPAGNSNWYSPVALDGIVLVIHPDNPVRSLTRAQIQAIYSGNLAQWSDVGGSQQAISLIGRERGSGVRRLFQQQIMGEQRESINTVIQPGNEEVLAAVAADPAAIGYTMMGALPTNQGDVVAVAVDRVEPTSDNTATQAYPLTVPLYFVASEEPAGPEPEGAELRAFLAWLQSADGQIVLGEIYGRVR